MRFILDSSTIVKLFLIEEDSTEAMDLMKIGYSKNVNFMVSELVKYEVGNAFWKNLRKRDDDGRKFMREFLTLNMDYIPLNDDLAIQVMKIAHENDITYYDGVHIALSEKYNVQLVTDDKTLLDKFDKAITIKAAFKQVKNLDLIALDS